VYPIAAGIVVQTRELWDELNRSLQDLSVRLLFELSELPPDWAGFLDRIDRVRPDVIMLDVTKLREPLEDVVKRIRSRCTPRPSRRRFSMLCAPAPASTSTRRCTML
jgi:hypothetical protein